jgi:uncharacterized Fe-S radical SAM superfamily protein PflX
MTKGTRDIIINSLNYHLAANELELKANTKDKTLRECQLARHDCLVDALREMHELKESYH